MPESPVLVVERKRVYAPAATVVVKASRKRNDDSDDDNNEDHVNDVKDDLDDYDSQTYSSHGADRLGDIESRATRSVHRVSRSFDKGVTTYISERDKSSARRRDGAIVDLVENASIGLSTAVSEVAPVLTDIAAAANTRQVRRVVRQVARTLGKLPFFG